MSREPLNPDHGPALTRDDVVDTALSLGLTTFTLVGVAGRLEVPTSALYRVIDSREDLLRACLERISQECLPGFDDLSGSWQEVAERYSQLWWDQLEHRPGLAHVLMSSPWAYSVFATVVGSTCAGLEAGGLPAEEALVLADLLVDTVVATHLQLEALEAAGGSWAVGTLWNSETWLRHRIGIVVDGVAVRAGAGGGARSSSAGTQAADTGARDRSSDPRPGPSGRSPSSAGAVR
ncbi:TetR/AcrR family transcriptional regulator [Actinomyces weissii]|uniref:TetR/AcrR family transcriptional regulator n=1 Tax=Actinomyces weissii TaxID=675090 RepID=A0A7T7S2A1_9ACTO|nr:TetR/AcrR family transcriptional regulator [Actinomyces weissii]QQM67801.1 TetR/AcrR family transcriptional regulator [Actinomyces weissii]